MNEFLENEDGKPDLKSTAEKIAIDSRNTAQVGGYTGAAMSWKLTADMPATTKRNLCKAICGREDCFSLDYGFYAMSQPLVLDKKEFFVVSGRYLNSGEDDPSFCIPSLNPSEPIFTFRNSIGTTCWCCYGEIGEEGCNECYLDKDCEIPFSSNIEAARKFGEEQENHDEKYLFTEFELLSGSSRDATVLGRATIRYVNDDNDIASKAGPTITRIESCHGSATMTNFYSNLLDGVEEWVALIFPHRVELQVDHSVWQEQMEPDGQKLFKKRGWCDPRTNGDYRIILGKKDWYNNESEGSMSDNGNNSDSDDY
jgi:hypothetical protein